MINTSYDKDAKAIDDCNSICVIESICGKDTKVESSTKATGNLLANDKNLQCDPSYIFKISDSKYPNGISPNAKGEIIIKGNYGTLTVQTKGSDAGKYCYELNKNAIPKDGAYEKFTYSIKDKNGCDISCADLKIDIDVKTIKIPEAKAVDDCNSVCIIQTTCGCEKPEVKSTTKANGNLLTNDKNLDCDPSCIIKIVSKKDPGGETPNAKGEIIIKGDYGILTVQTKGNDAGKYCYELNPGASPKDGANDKFTYTIQDKNGCDTSCADLKIDIEVKTIKLPEPDANNDCDAICVIETTCGCEGENPTLKYATKAQGCLLGNDKDLECPTITGIKFGHNQGVLMGNEFIIAGTYGTLKVQASGDDAGKYTYELNEGVVPPENAQDEVFSYTVENKDGCEDSAELKIDLDVKLIRLQEPDANNDCDAICVIETTCGCEGENPTLKSATKAQGCLLGNDKDLECPTITGIKFGHNQGVLMGNEFIIAGTYGTLKVQASGDDAGKYTYELNEGVVPPENAQDEVFSYTVENKDGCEDSAELKIDLDVKLIRLQEPDAKDDCDAICVIETTCGCEGENPTLKSATKAQGCLLGNDKDLECPTITGIKFGHNQGVLMGNEFIIAGTYGTLKVQASGDDAGKYTYELNEGVVPPENAQDEVFSYTVENKDGCEDSAELKIDLDVKLIRLQEPDANNDCDAICVIETTCGCEGENPTLKSATKAQGCLLGNDKDLECPTITGIKFGHNQGVLMGNEFIIAGTYGTLKVQASGDDAGKYTYELNEGVVPPENAQDEVFSYTVENKDGCEDSAELKIDLDVKLIRLQEPDANNDCDAICIVETVCGCEGENPTVKSSTTAKGNLLTNDKALDCATISQIKFGQNTVTPDSKGKIVISGEYGTLTVHTEGAKAGKYSYELNEGATPPKNAADEVFTYTIKNKDGCDDSAQLRIDLDVKLIKLPESKAVDDCDSIKVVETVCGKNTKVESSTKAKGNLLSNDKNIDVDPSCIVKIATAQKPNGAAAENGQIIIAGLFGILTVYTDGAKAGKYVYELNADAVPPKAGASEKFTYTLQDKDGCSPTTADLTIDINVKQVYIPEPPACDNHRDCDDNPKDNHHNNNDHHGKGKGNDHHGRGNDHHGKGDDHHDKGNDHHGKGNDHHGRSNGPHDKGNQDCDKRDNHRKHDDDHDRKDDHRNDDHKKDCDNRSDNQQTCGNINDCGEKENEKHNDAKVISFRCHDEHNKLIECKPGQCVKTQQGGEFTMHENGNFSYCHPKDGKSFNEQFECTTKDCHGKKETHCFGIHTDDMNPHNNDDQHSKDDHCDYIVDISDVKSCSKLSMKDLGIGHFDFGNLKGGECHDGKGQDNTLNAVLNPCQSATHCELPPLVGHCAPIGCAPGAIDQHLQIATQELHVEK